MAVLPDESVAITVMEFVPSIKVTFAFQLVVPVAMIPFTETDAMSISSDAVPDIVIMDVFTFVPLRGEVILRLGDVLSVSAASMRRTTKPLSPSATYA